MSEISLVAVLAALALAIVIPDIHWSSPSSKDALSDSHVTCVICLDHVSTGGTSVTIMSRDQRLVMSSSSSSNSSSRCLIQVVGGWVTSVTSGPKPYYNSPAIDSSEMSASRRSTKFGPTANSFNLDSRFVYDATLHSTFSRNIDASRGHRIRTQGVLTHLMAHGGGG